VNLFDEWPDNQPFPGHVCALVEGAGADLNFNALAAI
jgi:hypothetical protein